MLTSCFRIVLVCLSLVFCAQVHAAYDPSWYTSGYRQGTSYGCCTMPWGLGFSVEGLWWRPCRPNLPIAYLFFPDVATAGKTKVKSIEPDYSLGVKAGFSFHAVDYCSFIQVTGLWFQGRYRGLFRRPPTGDTFVPGISGTTANGFTFSDGQVRNYYGMGALRLGFYPFKRCCSTVYMVGGGRLFWIKERQVIRAINNETSAQIKQTLYLRGGAVEVGIGGDVRFFRFLALRGHVLGLGVIAERRGRFDEVRAPSPIVCIPGIDAKLGIALVADLWWFQFAGEIGYQIDYYFNGFEESSLARQRGTVNPSTIRNQTDVGFAGPYASFWLSF